MSERAVLDDVDLFDAAFFGIDPREAEVMDPQHRVFLEVAWEALEDAACDPERYAGTIGLFAGVSLNTYLLSNLCADRKYVEELTAAYQQGECGTIFGNDKDFLTSRVAYKMNLRGPVMTVQTACSTSLVAVAQACQSLQNHQCDTALAGAVSISFPQVRGYHCEEGAMGSPDGHCRAFDAAAQGTVFGDGCGIVVLKRLADAVAEGDCIRAVIKGAAINNDGSGRVSYTAPSAEGQAEVIIAAQAAAHIGPESISYIEAHGSGMPLGDQTEVAALTQAFRAGTLKNQFCAIGSAKTNLGHLDVASGVTGLIKTTLALEYGILPPSLHFTRPNPGIDFENSPFFVNSEARPWLRTDAPRRAGVSSFGIGGTNAHIILEEAPALSDRPAAIAPQVLVLSAMSATALDLAFERLAAHLETYPGLFLRDVAFTLQTGRRAFDFRRFLVTGSVSEAVQLLRSRDPERVFTRGGLLPPEENPQLAAGRRWLMGQEVDWPALHGASQPRRLPLPCYPFERQRYWVEPPRQTAPTEEAGESDFAMISREPDDCAGHAAASMAPDRCAAIELWPSSASAGGDPIFDEARHHAMTADRVRNHRFQEAFVRAVRDKVVIDVGCGRDAILSRLCVEAGARKVYAMPIFESPASHAGALIQKLRLAERITVIHGNLTSLRLPEPADVCVSANVGHVGGAEGWDLVLAKAAHLLKPGAPMIPARCETLAAAVALPEEFMREPIFSKPGADYAGRLFAQAGYRFDLRLSITGTDRSRLCSSIGIFEEIDFRSPKPWSSRPLQLTVERRSRIHGFLLWVRIEMAPGIILDTIDHQASWLPVFLPVFPRGLDVEEGDFIDAEVTGALAENATNRDYVIDGKVMRDGKPVHSFDFTSWHYKQVFKGSPFYETLFASGTLPVAAARTHSAAGPGCALTPKLPAAMAPGDFSGMPLAAVETAP